jgi:hypothetical protein
LSALAYGGADLVDHGDDDFARDRNFRPGAGFHEAVLQIDMTCAVRRMSSGSGACGVV